MSSLKCAFPAPSSGPHQPWRPYGQRRGFKHQAVMNEAGTHDGLVENNGGRKEWMRRLVRWKETRDYCPAS